MVSPLKAGQKLWQVSIIVDRLGMLRILHRRRQKNRVIGFTCRYRFEHGPGKRRPDDDVRVFQEFFKRTLAMDFAIQSEIIGDLLVKIDLHGTGMKLDDYALEPQSV